MTNIRLIALRLACAAQALVLALPLGAQGLRIAPQPAAGLGAARAAGNAPQRADYIVAVVNSEPITNNEVRTRMVQFAQQLQQQGQSVPAGAEFAREVLERLISEKAQLQLARENGIKVDESAVDQAEESVARRNQIDVSELRRRLASEGMSLKGFRDELRDQLMITRLRERELESRVKVNDLEVDQFIRDRASSTDLSTLELNLAHILVAVPENASPAQVAEAKAKADALLQRARSGEDFIKLGREATEAGGGGISGGVVGLRAADRYPPLFVQAVKSLPEGGVSEVVRSGAGFHVIKVIEKRNGGLPGATVVQSHARHILLRPSAQLSESAARQRLLEFKQRVQSGRADFAQLAREFSQDGSASNGGDLGWAAPGMFVPEFEDVLNSLAPGQIADPIVTRFGVHLIQLLERRQATLTQREQRDIARNLLREKKLDEAYVQWAQEVRGRAYVEFRDPPS
jgi:peptidyl-prolyl cis-trans isomerase SurA